MSELSAGMQSALAADTVTVFGGVKIVLPAYTIRLLDGPSTLVWDAETYTGEDATYGVLAAAEGLEDGAGDRVPSFSLTFHPPSATAAADLADPLFQGSAVTVWFGCVDPATGVVVSDPYGFIVGELDVPELMTDRGVRELTYECASALERFFDIDEGFRLSSGFHKTIWAGETGFDNITEVDRKDGWGIADGGTTGGSAMGGARGTKPERGPGGYNFSMFHF